MNYMRRNITFEFEKDTFSESGQERAFIKHEVLLLMNFFAKEVSGIEKVSKL